MLRNIEIEEYYGNGPGRFANEMAATKADGRRQRGAVDQGTVHRTVTRWEENPDKRRRRSSSEQQAPARQNTGRSAQAARKHESHQ